MRFLQLSVVAVLKTLLCKGISLVLLTGWFVRETGRTALRPDSSCPGHA